MKKVVSGIMVLLIATAFMLYSEDKSVPKIDRYKKNNVALSSVPIFSNSYSEKEIASMFEEEVDKENNDTLRQFLEESSLFGKAIPGVPLIVRDYVPFQDGTHFEDYFYYTYEYNYNVGVVSAIVATADINKKNYSVLNGHCRLFQRDAGKSINENKDGIWALAQEDVIKIALKLGIGPLVRKPIPVSLWIDNVPSYTYPFYWYFETFSKVTGKTNEYILCFYCDKYNGNYDQIIDDQVDVIKVSSKSSIDYNMSRIRNIPDSVFKRISDGNNRFGKFYTKSRLNRDSLLRENLSIKDKIELYSLFDSLDGRLRYEIGMFSHQVNLFQTRIANPKTRLNLYQLEDQKRKDGSFQWKMTEPVSLCFGEELLNLWLE